MPLIMASECEDDEQFQQMVHQIGGKSNIHLISAVCGPDGDTGVIQDFLAAMFNHDKHEEMTENTSNGNGEIKIKTTPTRKETDGRSPDQSTPDRSENHDTRNEKSSSIQACRVEKSKDSAEKNKTVRSSANVSGKDRAIKCGMIIFIFSHEYASNKENHACLREIVKDVRARIKRNAVPPAVLGLILGDCDRSEIRESVGFLDQSLRSVFINHARQAIWTGCYVTKSPDGLQEIKRNACKAVKSSLCEDGSTASKGRFFWTVKCLPGIFRKGHGRQADITSDNWHQANAQTTDEGIPLQTRATPQ